jgi:hypothetical protein
VLVNRTSCFGFKTEDSNIDCFHGYYEPYSGLLQAVDHPYLVLYSLTAQPPEGCHDNAALKTDCSLCNSEAENLVVCYILYVLCFLCFFFMNK